MYCSGKYVCNWASTTLIWDQANNFFQLKFSMNEMYCSGKYVCFIASQKNYIILVTQISLQL